jgi:hypothetical protein
MIGKLSPVFRLFAQQYAEAKEAFLALGKKYRGKKAVELEQRLIFLEIYTDLLSRIYFEEEKLQFKLFSPFKKIFKGLKKTKHLKFIMRQLDDIEEKNNLSFNSYRKQLENEKAILYTEVYDQIVATPLKVWEQLFEEVHQYSKGLKPLMINTSTTQIINEELEFFNLDNKEKLNSGALKDIYEGLRVITALENLRIESGFNSIFVQEVHDRMAELQRSLNDWYQNHLFLQHLTGYLADREHISKKYLELLSQLQANKKTYTQKVESQCKQLFERILE